jgi:hypothetical protein
MNLVANPNNPIAKCRTHVGNTYTEYTTKNTFPILIDILVNISRTITHTFEKLLNALSCYLIGFTK